MQVIITYETTLILRIGIHVIIYSRISELQNMKKLIMDVYVHGNIYFIVVIAVRSVENSKEPYKTLYAL